MTLPDEPSQQHPAPQQVVPTPPTLSGPILDYGSARESSQPQYAIGATLGFVFWIGMELILLGILYLLVPADVTGTCIAIVAAASILGLWLGSYLKYRGYSGFIPGLLLAMLLTCVLPLSAFALICGGPF